MEKKLTVLALSLVIAIAGCRRSKAVPLGPLGSVQPEPIAAAPFKEAPVLPGTPDVATLVEKVRPEVVNITVEEYVKVPRGIFTLPFDWPFELFGQPRDGQTRGQQEQPPDVLRQQAQGSGFIIDPQGHVVTNAHVADGASVVRVRLNDGREFKAHIKGLDKRLDVAVLEMEGAKDLPVVALGSSADLRVGEYVVAIGNPFGLGNTVTMGIVSAKSRAIGAGPYDDFIQTDASINPGNSGGPLFNLKGQVVGINTAISARGRGIGFAIPVDSLREVLPQLLTKGHVDRGRLGVAIQGMDWPLAKALGLQRPDGALVSEVEKGGPGERAGLKPGDVIVAVDDARIEAAQELPRTIARHAPNTKVKLDVVRDKRKQTVEATLGELKDKEEQEQPTTQVPSAPAHLGIDAANAPGGGALIQRIAPKSPAEGLLEAGDVVVEADHEKVSSARELESILRSAASPVLLKVRHDDDTRFVAIETR